MIRRMSFVALALLAASVTGVTPAVAGGPRPFHSRVVATWDHVQTAFTPAGASFLGYGLTTHMGRAVQEGDLFLTGFDPVTGNAPGFGSVTLTASNGDQLTFDYIGTLNAYTGIGTGIFTFTGGTGRFAGATGEGMLYAVIDVSKPANQAMTVVLDGTVTY